MFKSNTFSKQLYLVIKIMPSQFQMRFNYMPLLFTRHLKSMLPRATN